MKKFISTSITLALFILSVCYLFSCCTAFVPSSFFSYTVFFALLFPYLFSLIALSGIVYLFFNKKRALLFFGLLLFGLYNFFHVVAISPRGWTMQKDSNSLRIMTWNVSDFINPAQSQFPESLPRKQILQTIQEYNPDVLCLQEYMNVDSSRDVASVKHELDSLGYHYLFFSDDQVTHEFWGKVERGVAIASKTPFLKTGIVQIRNDWKKENLAYADVNFNNKTFRVHTSHLTSFYLFPDSVHGYDGTKTVAKKIYTYKRNVQEKLRDIELMHDVQAGNIRRLLDSCSFPVVYCGDMNATSCMYSYHKLKGNSQDAFLQKGSGIGATFYKIIPTLRIDMCFPDDNFSVQQCTVVQRHLGDHKPVVTDIAWKQK